MASIVKYQVSCPCGESSDAYSEWDDGHGYCFSCSKYFPHGSSEKAIEDQGEPEAKPSLRHYTTQTGPYRGLSEATISKYGCQLRIGDDGEPFAIQYPYGDHKKVRTFPKTFHQEGACKDVGCFGISSFSRNASRIVTITEGEDDAMAAYEMLGSKYPVVSLQSSATAKRDVVNSFDWLNSFEKIYLCLDSDEAGKKASKIVASLFDYNKVFFVKLDRHKDAEEYFANGETKEFTTTWWGASKFMPEGVVSSFSAIDGILDGHGMEAIADYPFSQLQHMSYGIRPSEVILITAPSGVGKTEFCRALEHHLIKTTEDNIGIVHLEEEKERCVKGLVGYDVQKPIHLPGFEVDPQYVKNQWRALVRRDHRVHLYSHFGSDDPDAILNTIRFMSSHAECKYIFLDHITMLVTGLETDDERRKLDYLSTKLGTMAREHDFALFLVSHVNSEGGTHGSKNIHRIADCRIHLERDVLNADPEVSNLMRLAIQKNRFGARVGNAGLLRFNPETFILSEIN